jgi:hypothetical protein
LLDRKLDVLRDWRAAPTLDPSLRQRPWVGSSGAATKSELMNTGSFKFPRDVDSKFQVPDFGQIGRFWGRTSDWDRGRRVKILSFI